MSVSIAELKSEHPQYYRVESKFQKSLHSRDACEFLMGTNSTHVLIHYFGQYMYARPNKDFGSKDGFSKQTLNWLNRILFLFVLLFIFLFMLLLPAVCLGTGVYGLVSCNTDGLSYIQLIVVGGVALVEFVARVVWYIIGRLDTKDSIFTFIEIIDFLPIPIVAFFIWGIIEGARILSCSTGFLTHIPLPLNILGLIGWGPYVYFRLQKFAIHIFDGPK